VLLSRQRQSDDVRAPSGRERPGRSTVPAADVTHADAGRQAGTLGDEPGQVLRRGFGVLVAFLPEAVVQILSPQLAVESVELVVVPTYRFEVGRPFGPDQRGSPPGLGGGESADSARCRKKDFMRPSRKSEPGAK